jgi:hypothetical protein
MGKQDYLDACCAFYQSAKYLMENDEHPCNISFYFDLGIFSSMQLAFADTGNQSMVLEVIKRPQEFNVNN